jgi:hypothetical protein
LSLASDHPSHDILTPASSKRRCNEAHAQRRLAERHSLDPALVATITRLVMSSAPQAVPLRHDRDHPNRQWYAVWIEPEQRWVPIVWDQSTGSVVTCLHWDKITRYHTHLASVEASWRDWSEDTDARPEPAPTHETDPLGPLIPAGTTITELLARIEARKAQIRALHNVLKQEGLRPNNRKAKVRKLHKVTAELRALKWAVVRTQNYWNSPDVKDQPISNTNRDDPFRLLVLAERVITKLRQQIGWDVAPPHARDVANAITVYIQKHAPVVRDEEPPCT